MHPPRLLRVLGTLALASYLGVAAVRSASSAEPAPNPHRAAFQVGDWPFKPPLRPEAPDVTDKDWVKNPIDRFVLADLEKAGLKPSPAADKPTLLRRVTFDLTGLPPTAAELAEFLADNSRQAYEKVVDRLLASPRFGERQAEHWLDVVRYAETDGFKTDGYRPNAHLYRDYVIKAFNDDLPYDRFMQQQLAGDELEPDNPDALIATGLNRLYPDEVQAANVRQRRQEILNDLTEVTGLTFLGLTVGCAQCHDHKFDQILQKDFYRLQAFFAPMEPEDVPATTAARKQEYDKQMATWEEATKGVRNEIEKLTAPVEKTVFEEVAAAYDPDTRQAVEAPEEKRTPLQEQLFMHARTYLERRLRNAPKRLQGDQRARYEELKKQLAVYDKLKPKPLPMAMAIGDVSRLAPPTFRLAAGTFGKPLEEVQPGFPLFLGASEPEITPQPVAADTTGRRSALAMWLSRKDHPLSSRVMANRIWGYHFGAGIVGTPNDFGIMGDGPSNADLLDWLAVELTEDDWHMKSLHKLIVMSATYQQSSQIDPDNEAQTAAHKADPANKLLWHFGRRRLEGEAIRDAMLQISGQLNLRMFGDSACPELPPDLYNDSSFAWDPDAKVEDRNRRSIYVFARRNLRYPMLEAFDQPDLHNSCAKRTCTTTAPQASLLVNGEVSLNAARAWAGQLLADHPDDLPGAIRAAYQQAFARPASDDEVAAAEHFIARQTDILSRSGREVSENLLPIPLREADAPERGAALVDFCHALFNSNEFLFID